MKKFIVLFLALSIVITSLAFTVNADNMTYPLNWDFQDGVSSVFNNKANATLSIVEEGTEKHLKIQAQTPSSSGSYAELRHNLPENSNLTEAILFETDIKTSSAYQVQSIMVYLNNNDITAGGDSLALVQFGQNYALKIADGKETSYQYSADTWYNIKAYLRLGQDRASHKLRVDITPRGGTTTSLYADVGDSASWKVASHTHVRTLGFIGAWYQQTTEIDNVKLSKWDCDLTDDFFTNNRVLHRFDDGGSIPELGSSAVSNMYVKPNNAVYSAVTGVKKDGRISLRFINNSGNAFPELFYAVSETKQPYASFDFMLAKGGFWLCARHSTQDILLSANADKAGFVYAHGDSTETGDPVAFSNGEWYRAAFSFDYTAKTFTVKLFNLEDNTTVVTGTYPLVENYFSQLTFFAWYNTELYVDNLIYGKKTDMKANFSSNDIVENHLSDGALLSFSNPIDPTNSNNSLTIDGIAVQAVDTNVSLGIRVPLSEVGRESNVEYTLYDIYGQQIAGTATVKAIDDYCFTSFSADDVLAAPKFTANATGKVHFDGTAKLMVGIYEKTSNKLKDVRVLEIKHDTDEGNYSVSVNVPTELSIDNYIAKAFLWQENNRPIEMAIVR